LPTGTDVTACFRNCAGTAPGIAREEDLDTDADAGVASHDFRIQDVAFAQGIAGTLDEEEEEEEDDDDDSACRSPRLSA
jgi:hypothetical protein